MKVSHHEHGATMLEFALVVSVLMAILFATLDLAYYFTVKSVLIKGAQDGLLVAKTNQDFGIDIEEITPKKGQSQTQAIYEKYNTKFLSARQKVIDAALALPLSSFISPSSAPGAVTLNQFSYIYSVNGVQTDAGTADIKILRPGESLKKGATWIDHPNVCASFSPTCNTYVRPRNSYETLSQLFRDYPVVVELEANANLLLPFLKNVTITGRAAGYREAFVRSTDNKVPAIPNLVSTTTTSTTTSSTGAGGLQSSTITTTSTSLPNTTVVSCDVMTKSSACANQGLCFDSAHPQYCQCKPCGGLGS